MILDDIADRGSAYGIPGMVVDGMNVLEVYEKAGEMIGKARDGMGPALIECKTYRYRGHSRFEPANYRTKEEVEEWKKKDPIEHWRKHLADSYLTEAQVLEEIDRKVEEDIEAAVLFAENSPDPEPEDYRKYIFA